MSRKKKVTESKTPTVTESKAMKDARAQLAAVGMAINKTDYGDYRVFFPKDRKDPDAGYFTDDLADAVATGIHISGTQTKEVRSEHEDEKRDERWVTLYDDEALRLMPGWTGGTSDPLYAISSSGGANYAWVFHDAIANLDADLAKVKKIGKNKFQLGQGTFTKKEIDELHTIHDALVQTLADSESYGSPESREAPASLPQQTHIVMRDFSTLPEVVAHAQTEGATHVIDPSPRGWASRLTGKVRLYYPYVGGDGQYTEGVVWREHGYWHSAGPAGRAVVDRLPPGAQPIEAYLAQAKSGRATETGHPGARRHAVRDYIAVDSRGRRVGGPFENYRDAKRHADKAGGYVEFTMGEAKREHRRPHAPAPTMWTWQNTKLATWFERDRAHVALLTSGEEATIIEWWDEAVDEAVQDGFLNPRDWHGSAVEYANYIGAQPVGRHAGKHQKAGEHRLHSGIGDSQRSPGDVEFRVVIRGFKAMKVWAPNLEKASRIAGSTAAAYRSEVVSVDPVGGQAGEYRPAAPLPVLPGAPRALLPPAGPGPLPVRHRRPSARRPAEARRRRR